MRLLRCHIEKFGVLSGFDYEFESGLTVICRENGFGKSTLAAFLKAMFYGLPRTGARTAANNERKRYEPWQGGKYGGFLEFSHGDTSYRVTRYFGKTAAKDSFEIYDLTNRTKETAFSEKLGEELFGLDAESFARSTFVPQLAARELEATSSIRAKLTNLVDDTNDMNNFDTAMAALRAYRSERKAYRGSNGEIDRLAEELRALEDERFRAEGKRPELESVLREIDAQNAQQAEKTAELALVRADIQKAAGQRERQLKKERLYELRAQVKQQDETMQALREKYPDGLPAAEEVRRQRENVISLRQLEKRQGTLVLSMEDRQVIEEGAPLFSDRVRVADDLDRLEAGQRELAALSIGNRAVMPEEETEQLEKYTRIFHIGLPDDAEISEKQQDCRRIAELCAVRDAKQAQKNEKKRPGSAKIAILALGALLLLAGIGCLVAEKLSLGIAAVVLGALSLAAALLWKKPLQAEDGADEEMQQIEQLQAGVTAFLMQFCPDASRPDEQLVQLRLDKDAYLRLREKESRLAKERQEQQVQIDALTRELHAILARYRLTDSEQTLLQAIRALRECASQYERVQEHAERLKAERQEMARQTQAYADELAAFFEKYRLSGQTDEQLIEQAEQDAHAFDAAGTASKEAKTRLADFLRENAELSEAASQEESLDMAALQEKETQTQLELAAQEDALRQLRQKRDALRHEVEKIPALEDELAELGETRSAMQKQCELADLTMDYLTRAKDTLANSYVGRVEQGFVRYADALLGEKIGHVMLDRELHLFIDEQGAARDAASFSAGTVDGVMLCMRLALVDALFQKEQPFLLLDDPFVNLDDEATCRALSMLRELAKQRQVVYLTCNTARI